MKASDLILIWQKNPDAELLVSTTQYYEGSYQDAGYKRTGYQIANSFTLDLEENQIKLNGGEEKRI